MQSLSRDERGGEEGFVEILSKGEWSARAQEGRMTEHLSVGPTLLSFSLYEKNEQGLPPSPVLLPGGILSEDVEAARRGKTLSASRINRD